MKDSISTSARSRVLFVTSSPREDSHSAHVAEAFLTGYRSALAAVQVDRLNTFTDLPAFAGPQVRAKMAVIAGQEVPDVVSQRWSQVLETAARVRAADTLLFAVPMWNGGIPWSLKLFIDIVTQPGEAFRFDPVTGYTGLLAGRRAVVAYTSRVYVPGLPTSFGVDHQSTYFGWWLRYCGIDEIHELHLRPTFPGDKLTAERARVSTEAHALGRTLATATPKAGR